jgi:hypothetical protein
MNQQERYKTATLRTINNLKNQITKIDSDLLELANQMSDNNQSELVNHILIEQRATLLLQKNTLQYSLQNEENKINDVSDLTPIQTEFIQKYPLIEAHFKTFSSEKKQLAMQAINETFSNPILLKICMKHFFPNCQF